ncbi:MAG: pilus assembly protein TadG-related protein, partial [Ornithinimicrobium sp.]
DDPERGAVAVVVALLMVPLLALAAIAIDVAAIYADRQQLQTGSDAAALAIAQTCATGPCDQASASQTATSFVQANKNDASASATAELTTSQATVRAVTTREHFFAPVLGVEQTDIGAESTVGWGAPTGGTSVLPVAFSLCEWQEQLAANGGELSETTLQTIYFTKSSDTTCTGNSGNLVPGGFGWLTPDAGTCNATTGAGGILYSDPGESVPSGCTTADFADAQYETVLLPLFDQYDGSGSSAIYRIYGYAAFKVTGYHFVGQYSWNAGGSCKGNARCLQGYFVEYVDTSDAFEYGAAPDLGAVVAALVLPEGT